MEDFNDDLPDEAYELLIQVISLHPAIQHSITSAKDKLYLQYLLEEEFGGDINLLLEDIQKFAIDVEEYEVAATIRDYLNDDKNEKEEFNRDKMEDNQS